MPTDDGRADASESELLVRWDSVLPGQTEIGQELVRRYAEPHRRYHTAEHLLQVLQTIDGLATRQDLFVVRLAAWFHDAVYAIPVGQVSNEEASARLAIRMLGRAGLEQEDLTQVARLVRLTATHVPGSRDPEGELLCDADLAILAAEPEQYRRYTEQIRQEYAAVPETTFWLARLDVLTPLAEREIFRTGRGRALAPAARRNLLGEISELTDKLEAQGLSVQRSEV